MLGIRKDAACVCSVYLGTVCARKAQRSFRDAVPRGSQKAGLRSSVGGLRTVGDDEAKLEALASPICRR